MRRVIVIPAGRKRYLECLLPYIRRERNSFNEVRFWLNTADKSDIAYIESVAAADPDFFKITRMPIAKPPQGKEFAPAEIHRFYPTCHEDDTLYLRLDDDIVWCEDGALTKFAKFREDNPTPFLVFGNILNNGICAHIHNRIGAVPVEHGVFTYECTGDLGWKNPRGAEIQHDAFFKHLEDGTLDAYKFSRWRLWEPTRFSINCMSWLGSTIKTVVVESDEEQCLTQRLSVKLKSTNEICGDALFVHFAFCTQRNVIEPKYLCRYRKLAHL